MRKKFGSIVLKEPNLGNKLLRFVMNFMIGVKKMNRKLITVMVIFLMSMKILMRMKKMKVLKNLKIIGKMTFQMLVMN